MGLKKRQGSLGMSNEELESIVKVLESEGVTCAVRSQWDDGIMVSCLHVHGRRIHIHPRSTKEELLRE